MLVLEPARTCGQGGHVHFFDKVNGRAALFWRIIPRFAVTAGVADEVMSEERPRTRP